VHQRVAATYRAGRALLAGDAAHVNNPLGGMGMNFGIHDAVSLADKLSRVLNGESEDLLDLYDRQRRYVANAFLQAMTIQNKRVLEEKDPQKRNERMQEMRETVADPAKARTFCVPPNRSPDGQEGTEDDYLNTQGQVLSGFQPVVRQCARDKQENDT
jgi:3-(3-hydroxy-phenyl)propionate hydroxylase